MHSDPIADMLTRIRNANAAHHREVFVPQSRMKLEIARLLKEEGFIEDYSTVGGEEGEAAAVASPAARQIRGVLKPHGRNVGALSGLTRVSKPGLRIYSGKDKLPEVMGGFGVSIISTSRGLMTGKAARRAGLGGEVVARVW